MDLKSYSVMALLVAGMAVVAVRAKVFDCSSFNPLICTADSIMFCLTNGTIISGRCHAQRAVCLERASLDETFAACSHRPFNIDCSQYNPIVCSRDLIPFCLRNGTVIRGTCLAKRAVCIENQQVDQDFSSCDKEGSAGPRSRNRSGNGATAITATLPLVLALVLFSSM